MDDNKIKEGVKLILEGIGEDIYREGLLDTPDRIARMCHEICGGLSATTEDVLSKTFSINPDNSDMVLEKDITFYSLCEHHLLPFYGKAHIAYVPNGRVVGLSKLARCVDIISKRPQIQEKMTADISDAIMKYLEPKGVIVMLEAEHMCMTMRGIKKPGTKTCTIIKRGICEDDFQEERFFRLLGNR